MKRARAADVGPESKIPRVLRFDLVTLFSHTLLFTRTTPSPRSSYTTILGEKAQFNLSRVLCWCKKWKSKTLPTSQILPLHVSLGLSIDTSPSMI